MILIQFSIDATMIIITLDHIHLERNIMANLLTWAPLHWYYIDGQWKNCALWKKMGTLCWSNIFTFIVIIRFDWDTLHPSVDPILIIGETYLGTPVLISSSSTEESLLPSCQSICIQNLNITKIKLLSYVWNPLASLSYKKIIYFKKISSMKIW